MNDTVSPRAGAARLRTICLRVGAFLSAICALATIPTHAAARAPKLAHAPGEAATIRVHSSRSNDRRRTRPQTSTSPRCGDAHAPLGSVSRADTERATLCLLNLRRSAQGLPALRGSRPLDDSAQRWTNTMVDDRAFSHGSDFGARISAAGFRWSQIGENIAAGYRTPSGVVTAWMRSLGHCQNILSPEFGEVGAGFAPAATGAARMRGGTWTLDLGLLMGQPVPSRDWTPAEHCPD